MAMRSWAPIAWLAVATNLWCWPLSAATPVAQEPQRTDLIQDMPAAGDLAAPANGQTLYILDESRGEVVAIDPFEPTKRWIAVAGSVGKAADGGPLAIGCIDTSLLAVLSNAPDGWSLQTHRLQPGKTVDPAKPTQSVAIGRAPGNASTPAPASPAGGPTADGRRPCLAVSPSRDWLGICGLPAPLPAVLRAPIAGARIGSVSARACPVLPAGVLPSAATISTAEEFVLFTPDPADRANAGIFVSFYLPPDPRRLLHLDTSLPQIRDAAFCRADGTLWVVGGGVADAGGRGDGGSDRSTTAAPEGLWRIDAGMRNGRQSAQAVCIARLDGARAVTCLSERAIIVTHGRGQRTVSRIDPTQPASTP
jgi:hypothetical protein